MRRGACRHGRVLTLTAMSRIERRQIDGKLFLLEQYSRSANTMKSAFVHDSREHQKHEERTLR